MVWGRPQKLSQGRSPPHNNSGTPSSSSSSTAATVDDPLPLILMQEPRLLWAEAEDAVLENLVQKAMEPQPDRWRRKLSRLLSDPKERVGLDPSRSFTKSIQRLDQIPSQQFVFKKQWTPGEPELLMKAVFSEWKDSTKSPPVYTPAITRVSTRPQQIIDIRESFGESEGGELETCRFRGGSQRS